MNSVWMVINFDDQVTRAWNVLFRQPKPYIDLFALPGNHDRGRKSRRMAAWARKLRALMRADAADYAERARAYDRQTVQACPVRDVTPARRLRPFEHPTCLTVRELVEEFDQLLYGDSGESLCREIPWWRR